MRIREDLFFRFNAVPVVFSCRFLILLPTDAVKYGRDLSEDLERMSLNIAAFENQEENNLCQCEVIQEKSELTRNSL